MDREAQKRYRDLARKNQCPKGHEWLNGTWEYIGESKIAGFKDVITFTGTRYTEQLSGGSEGKREAGTITGDFACLLKNRVRRRVDKVTPEGLFGNRSKTDYPCDVLTPVNRRDKDRFLMICFVEWDLRQPKGLDLEFRRVKPVK